MGSQRRAHNQWKKGRNLVFVKRLVSASGLHMLPHRSVVLPGILCMGLGIETHRVTVT